MTTVEGWHEVDGRKLYTKTWKPDGPVQARIAFVHGFSDHCNRYGTLFPFLASKGIEVYGFDQAGWGRSVLKPSDKGVTGPTSRVFADITSFLRTLIPSPVPLFLYGHSMGGAEVLLYAVEGPADVKKHIRGYLAESPWLALHPSTQPSGLTISLGKLAAKLLPRMQKVAGLQEEYFSRDPVNNRSVVEDPLCHQTGTLEQFACTLDRADALESGRIQIGEGHGEGGTTRIWLSHGTGDLITSFEASKKFAEREKKVIKDFELKVYDGWYHQLHAEPSPDKETFANDVVDWMLQRLEVSGQSPEKSKL